MRVDPLESVSVLNGFVDACLNRPAAIARKELISSKEFKVEYVLFHGGILL
jgi:hypothetical protein